MKKLVSIFLALILVFVASFSFESVSFAADDDLGIRLKNSFISTEPVIFQIFQIIQAVFRGLIGMMIKFKMLWLPRA